MSTTTQIAPAAKKEDTAIAKAVGKKASEMLAESLGLDPAKMIDVIKAQCFQGQDASKVTNEVLAAFCVVAHAHGINPLLPGMMYGYPTKSGGFVAMLGPDAVMKLIQERKDVRGFTTEHETDKDGNLVACVVTIYRRDDAMPARKRCLLSEWRVDTNPNWKQRPVHMLELRTLKQCARQVIHGLPLDEEELQMIDAQQIRPGVFEMKPGENKSAATARAIATRQAPPEIVVPPASEPASTNSGTDPDGEPVDSLFS